jgi:hypothetical protein
MRSSSKSPQRATSRSRIAEIVLEVQRIVSKRGLRLRVEWKWESHGLLAGS